MPVHHHDELPTLDASDLSQVSGGTGSDMSSMLLPMMMMMMNRSKATAAAAAPQASAPAPAIPAWMPKITVDGVEQPVTASADGTTFTSTTPL